MLYDWTVENMFTRQPDLLYPHSQPFKPNFLKELF